MQSDRMNNPKYGYWIKSGTSLVYVKDGLVDEISNQANLLHNSLKANIQSISPYAASTVCTTCTSRDIKKCRGKHGTTWTIRCQANVCNIWLDEILKYCRVASYQHIVWQNVDPRKWPTTAWEVVKTFMPHGCQGIHSAQESDCAALLSLMINCIQFHKLLSNPSILTKVLGHRNRIMHAATLEIEESEFMSWTNDMICLLEDPKYFRTHPSTINAVTKIKQLQQNPIDIRLCKDQEIKVLTQMIKELTHHINEYQQDQKDMKQEQEINHLQTGKIKENMEALQVQVEGMRDKLKELDNDLLEKRKSNTDECKHDVDTEGVRRRLMEVYQKNCVDIPIYPLTPEITGKLPKLFVKPSIKVRPRSSQMESTETVDSLVDLFGTSKKIYIVGDAGIGKSTFCDYMVHIWCCTHTNTDVHLNRIDSIKMKSFPLLFYISLRYALPGQTIEEMIESQLDICYTELLCDDCLIVLDGLDEWQAKSNTRARFRNADLPQLKTESKCTIITTTRPWKLETLRLGVADIDKELTMTGLDRHSISLMANRLIEELNTIHQRDKSANEFVRAMESNNLDHFMKVPVLLKQMLCLWYDDVSLGDSQFQIYMNMIERQLKLAEQDKDIRNLFRSRSICTQYPQLKQCLQEYPLCTKYQNIITALARTAFYTLLSEKREYALVFDHDVTQMYGLSEIDVEACLKIGLLSQKQIYGKITERKKSLNFIHKSHQELFAAVFLATDTGTKHLETVKKMCSSLQMVHEIENLMYFLCGLNKEVCKELVIYLKHLMSNDTNLKKYRENEEDGYGIYKHTFLNVQKFIISLTKELHCNYDQSFYLPINDIAVDKTNVIQLAESLKMLNMRTLESLFIDTKDVEDSSKGHFQEVLESARFCNSLVKLFIDDRSTLFDAADICNTICNCRTTLKSLHLSHVDLTGLQRVHKPLEAMLKNFTPVLLHFEQDALTTEQVKTMTSFLCKTDSLRTLIMVGSQRETVTELCYTLNIKRNLHLQHICLQYIYAEKVILEPRNLLSCKVGGLKHSGCIAGLMRCLVKCKTLENLECEDVVYDIDKSALIETLPKLVSLKRIALRGIDFGEKVITVSPHMKNLKTIRMFKVKMKNMAFKALLDKLPPQELRIDLDMVNLSMAEGTPHIPEYIRRSEKRYTVLTHYKNRDGNWHIVFDKTETEDISELSI